VVGEGLEALKDAGAISRAREDITAGFGISLAMILSNEANYATAIEDRKTLYTNTVLPLGNFIAEVWNEQLFQPMGYKFMFRHEGMEIFQEDENDRAASLNQIVTSLADPELFLIAAEILGYDLTNEQIASIEGLVAKKDERRAAMAEQLKPKDEPPTPPQPGEQPPQLQQGQDNQAQADETAKFKRKSLRSFKAGKGADVEFESDVIDASLLASIHEKLACANTEDEIKAAFVFDADESIDKTAEQVLEGIRLGVEALKHDEAAHPKDI
jgi:hypothetical protein